MRSSVCLHCLRRHTRPLVQCYTRAAASRRAQTLRDDPLESRARRRRPASIGPAREALTALCEIYWYPLYAFLRGRGHSPADAEDLTQAFFALLLEKQVIRHADPAKGRFRSFLLKSLQNFAANPRTSNAAAKRGGGVRALSLEFDQAEGRLCLEGSTAETPERRSTGDGP